MTQLVNTRYGTMECLSSDSVVSQSLLRYGEWAQFELDLIATLLRPGDVALDIGAFLGTHTLGMAAMVGPTGRVHSFEPRAAIRLLLEGNVRRNGLVQVKVQPFAAGAANETMTLPAINIESQANFGGLALDPVPVAEGKAVEEVQIRKLDDLGLGRVDFLKIDAEGMEAAVLTGARSMLAACQPALLAECNDLEHGGSTFAACREQGYELFGVLSPAYNPANLRGETENMFGEASEVSVLALPPSRAEALDPAVLPHLAPLATLDDLALLLLHKVQYPLEVLASSNSARVLGIDYGSPLARRLREELVEVRAALEPAYARADAAEQRASMAEQNAALAARAAAAAQAVAASLQLQAQQPLPPRGLRGWVQRLRGATQ